MNRAEPLRGNAAFDRVFNGGRKIGGTLTFCFYLVRRTEKAALHVGYAVSSRRWKAVRRNRMRRLMREAVRYECAPLCAALARQGVTADLVLVLRPRPDVDIQRISLAQCRADLAAQFDRLTQRIIEAPDA